MEQKFPLVSVIMNCYNGETYLKESISSLINQTYKNWELIFWDNFSSDSSKEVLMQFSDKRIKYYYTKNFTPLYEARNLAIKKTSGEFISFLDTDDWWSPKRLEKQIELFFKDKNLDVVYTNFYLFYNKTKTKKIISKKNLPVGKITQKLLDHYNIGGILTALCKKKIFQTKQFIGKYEIIGDFDFFVDVSLSSFFGCIKEPLAYYRVHESNRSFRKIHLHIQELESWLKNNKIKDHLKNYSFKGVIFNLQSLKIKKSFLDGNKIAALQEIIKSPFNFKKYKFLILFFIPRKKISFLLIDKFL
jgi:glycosyltransferase involved in cell wall biosynthesis